MSREPSVVTVAEPADARTDLIFVAYGDRDDHLRLSVLIAEVLGRIVGDERSLGLRATCLDPRTSWKARLGALAELLDRVPSVTQPTTRPVLVDVDALYTGALDNYTRWDDRAFRAARDEFMKTIIAAVARGGWCLARPAPTHDVSKDLSDADLAQPPDVDTDAGRLSDIELRAQPEARPVLRWLLEREVLTPSTAIEAVETAGGDPFTEYLVFLAYDSLPPSARRLATRLAALRPPQDVNGAYGRYPLKQAAPEEEDGDDRQVSATALARLRECGFVQLFCGDPRRARMPRGVRQSLVAYAGRLLREELLEEHSALAASDPGEEGVENRIEAHHHAVLAEDVDRATATARYYVNDLRELAYRLSAGEQAFDKAAEVYDKIVQIDPSDAYAWEYLGYNLARTNRHVDDQTDRQRILDAYEKAVELEKHNPLFRGRLLGFRGEIGQDILTDLGHWLAHYDELWGTSGLGYFAEGILNGLHRGNRSAAIAQIQQTWGMYLLRAPRLSRFLAG